MAYQMGVDQTDTSLSMASHNNGDIKPTMAPGIQCNIPSRMTSLQHLAVHIRALQTCIDRWSYVGHLEAMLMGLAERAGIPLDALNTSIRNVDAWFGSLQYGSSAIGNGIDDLSSDTSRMMLSGSSSHDVMVGEDGNNSDWNEIVQLVLGGGEEGEMEAYFGAGLGGGLFGIEVGRGPYNFNIGC